MPARRAVRKNQPIIPCQQCGAPFSRKSNGKAKVHKFCSHACAITYRTGRRYTAETDKAARVRANGLVNKRLRLGWFVKPSVCMVCIKAPVSDSHHPDYSKPAEVLWVCRSCHTTLHHHPERANGIPLFLCNDNRTEAEKPKPHGKGGWRGERGNEYRNAHSSVTMETARAIRRMYADFIKQQDIAKHFGVSQMTVSRIVRNERMIESPLPAPTKEGA